jgi:hypothetical protein
MRAAVTRIALAAVAALGACSAPQRSRMYPAGTDRDDGYGDLAQMSARLYLGNGSDAPFVAHRHRARPEADGYGGDPYGGASYGAGAADTSGGPTSPGGSPIFPRILGAGGATSGPSRYTPTAGLTGAIDGTVRWPGAPPPPVATPCGAITSPLRVAANRAVAGVLVYIDHVEVGRTLPSVGRPATVGGLVTKRGCALAPALQILTPLPAELAIHGDAGDAKIRVVFPGDVARSFELQPAGRVIVPAPPGVTRVEADDSSLGAAWVVAATTPYFAITDELGRFRLDELAAGSYELTFWQPPLATSAGGKLVYGAPVIVHRTVKVDPAHPAHVDLTLP